MPELIAPTVRLHAAWLAAHREWGPGVHEDGFGLWPSDEVESSAGFAAWVARLAGQSHATCRWIVEGDELLGGIALRHEFDDLRGHIGYGIRPSARRRGLASWALAEMLVEARVTLGLDRVLIPCLADNTASARTIERNGGILEEILETDNGPVRRYWITLDR
jgi:predicted acetyltransferase